MDYPATFRVPPSRDLRRGSQRQNSERRRRLCMRSVYRRSLPRQRKRCSCPGDADPDRAIDRARNV